MLQHYWKPRMKFWKEPGGKLSPMAMFIGVSAVRFWITALFKAEVRLYLKAVKSCFGVLAVCGVFGRSGCSTQVRQFCLAWDTELGLTAPTIQLGSSLLSFLSVLADQLCLSPVLQLHCGTLLPQSALSWALVCIFSGLKLSLLKPCRASYLRKFGWLQQPFNEFDSKPTNMVGLVII